MTFSHANEDEIIKHLSKTNSNINILVVEECSSTSSILLSETERAQYFPNINPKTNLSQNQTWGLITHHQNNGRGQRENSWVDNNGGILFSLLWQNEKNKNLPSWSTLAFGIAVVETLTTFGINNVLLKWPNDLCFVKKNQIYKLGGMLLERKNANVVFGLGINVMPFENKSKQLICDNSRNQPISLSEITPENNFNLSPIIAKLIINLHKTWEDILNLSAHKLDFAYFQKRWQKIDVILNQTNLPNLPQIAINQNQNIICGTYLGINNDGAIEIIPENKTQKIAIFSGKVTII